MKIIYNNLIVFLIKFDLIFYLINFKRLKENTLNNFYLKLSLQVAIGWNSKIIFRLRTFHFNAAKISYC